MAGGALTLAVAVACAAGIAAGIEALAGPDYFRWPYVPLAAWPLWPLLLVAMAPIAAAVARDRGDALGQLGLALGALAIGTVALAARAEGPAWTRAIWILEDPQIHGYLGTARALCDDPGWLRDFAAHSAAQSVHVRVHPPGLVASYCGLRALAGDGPAVAPTAYVSLASLAALAPPLAYRLGRALGLSDRASLLGAACLALSPAAAVFCPSFDAVWPTWACALYLAAHHGMRGRLGAATGAGALLWVGSVSSYVLAGVGVPLAVLVAWAARERGWRAVGTGALVALGALLGLSGVAWLAGYDPVAVLAQALENQGENTARYFPTRHWPTTIGWDLWDFGRGLTWPLLVPALWAAYRATRDGSARWLVAFGFALPLLAALSGIWTTETVRTWMFMLPGALLVVGAELARWPRPAQLVALASTALVSGAVLQHELFVWS